MRKTYTSKTCVAISVQIRGKGCHIAFSPLTLGGSMYSTDDAEVQAAIERHRRFGQSIKVEEEPEPVTEAAAEEEEKEQEEGPIEVKVGSLAEAKELVVEKTGLSRSKLRSKADIEKAAEGAGIKLVFSE